MVKTNAAIMNALRKVSIVGNVARRPEPMRSVSQVKDGAASGIMEDGEEAMKRMMESAKRPPKIGKGEVFQDEAGVTPNVIEGTALTCGRGGKNG